MAVQSMLPTKEFCNFSSNHGTVTMSLGVCTDTNLAPANLEKSYLRSGTAKQIKRDFAPLEKSQCPSAGSTPQLWRKSSMLYLGNGSEPWNSKSKQSLFPRL